MRSSLRRTPLIAVLAVAVAAPPLVADAGEPASGAAPRAEAVVKVGGWTRLSDGNVSLLSEPNALALGSGGTQVVWYQEDAPLADSIRTRIVNEAGKPATDIRTVVKGWSTVVTDPRIIKYGSERMVVFGGIRSTNPGEKFYGPMAYATSSDGSSWTLGSGSLSETGYAYGSYGTAAVDDQGTPLIGVVAGTADHVTLHRGISPTVPAASGDWATSGLSGNSLYASLGRNAATGETWAVWVQAFGSTAQNGVIAQRVYPTPIGAWRKAPKSTEKDGDFVLPDQNVAVASRAGGEVWAAYAIGYPTANRIGLWRVGSKELITLRAPDVGAITLQPGSGGRLWLAWDSGTSGRVKVARTNPAVTKLGIARSFKPPSKKGSSNSVWSIAGSGRGGPLHLVINSQINSADPQIWYRKVLPGLRLVMSPRKLARGKVVATVTDAGAGVDHARVTFHGTSKLTNAQGKVAFSVARSVPDGKYRAKATKAGYAPGRAVVTVS